MEKFENGIYLIDDTKKNPNLTDIAFAFKNAQLKDAEKFVAIIRGMRFGYDERKRNILYSCVNKCKNVCLVQSGKNC